MNDKFNESKDTGVNRQLVCIMGLGFVGSAMAAVVASASNNDNQKIYNVIGVELANDLGRERSKKIQQGIFPFECADTSLSEAVSDAVKDGNLWADTDQKVFALADIIIVDIALDIKFDSEPVEPNFESFGNSIKTIGQFIKPGALVIIETTIPPGTCDNVILPTLADELRKRSMNLSDIHVAHSFERVMPGPNYMASIQNYWRAYSGQDMKSADLCESFLASIINTNEYPLTRLSCLAASETAKVLENSYRAVNIALIDEWSVFAEQLGLDLFEILDAIRKRPTHQNIMRPGLGVGGYCLTKDIFFGEVTYQSFYKDTPHPFKFTRLADLTNRAMPIRNLERVKEIMGGSLVDKKILILGIAYRSEVGDTRYTAAEKFYDAAISEGCEVFTHDPFVGYWEEKGFQVTKELPSPFGFDVVVFCVPHQLYRNLNIAQWLGNAKPLIYDCDGVLSSDTIRNLKHGGFNIATTGRGTLK